MLVCESKSIKFNIGNRKKFFACFLHSDDNLKKNDFSEFAIFIPKWLGEILFWALQLLTVIYFFYGMVCFVLKDNVCWFPLHFVTTFESTPLKDTDSCFLSFFILFSFLILPLFCINEFLKIYKDGVLDRFLVFHLCLHSINPEINSELALTLVSKV